MRKLRLFASNWQFPVAPHPLTRQSSLLSTSPLPETRPERVRVLYLSSSRALGWAGVPPPLEKQQSIDWTGLLFPRDETSKPSSVAPSPDRALKGCNLINSIELLMVFAAPQSWRAKEPISPSLRYKIRYAGPHKTSREIPRGQRRRLLHYHRPP